MLMLVLVLEMRALQSTFILGSKDNGLNLNSFALSVQAMRRFSSTSTAALSTSTAALSTSTAALSTSTAALSTGTGTAALSNGTD
jgi:hypothetical protein